MHPAVTPCLLLLGVVGLVGLAAGDCGTRVPGTREMRCCPDNPLAVPLTQDLYKTGAFSGATCVPMYEFAGPYYGNIVHPWDQGFEVGSSGLPLLESINDGAFQNFIGVLNLSVSLPKLRNISNSAFAMSIGVPPPPPGSTVAVSEAGQLKLLGQWAFA